MAGSPLGPQGVPLAAQGVPLEPQGVPLGPQVWGEPSLLFLEDTKSQQEPPASPQEIPHRSAQVHKRSPTNPRKPTSMDGGECFDCHGGPPPWWYMRWILSILVCLCLLALVGDPLWSCADLWGISCGLVGGFLLGFSVPKNSGSRWPPTPGPRDMTPRYDPFN